MTTKEAALLAKVERARNSLKLCQDATGGFKGGMSHALDVIEREFPEAGSSNAHRILRIKMRLREWSQVPSITEYGDDFGRAIHKAIAVFEEEFPDAKE